MNTQDAAKLAKAATVIVEPGPPDPDALEERLLALLHSYPSVAERQFALQVVAMVIEDETDEALLSAAGIDKDAPETWPLKNITYDYYDGSFEFKGVTEGWEPTPETLAAWGALGFARCWICYHSGPWNSGPEKYYSLR